METQTYQNPVNETDQPEVKESNPAEFNHDTVGHGVLREKDVRNLALLRIGHEGVMMDKINHQNQAVMDSVKGLQKEAGYEVSKPNPNSSGEDDMGVSIGNESRTETHHHYQQEPDKMSASNGNEQNKPAASDWKLPASILAAGALTGAGLYLSRDQPSNAIINPPAVVAPIDRDSAIDTSIGVGFGQPQKIEQLNLVPLDKEVPEIPEGESI